ncbi:MAG TPA: hypothetical protein VMD97_01700 [Candidatus Aquilonibacter sp.]|nr:hypothetical protein [Candidatus Aquilonibacter sp.]
MMTTASTPRDPHTDRRGWQAFAVVLPFLLLFWVDMWHHTMFFDEVNAWAISAASPTLAKMFYYVHFEGHPWLWYFILWFPSRLTHDPVAMKWVEAALGTAIILIVGLLSPFTWKQRALILSSYFLVWEYTVMCRMYSVMLLLVLLYVVRRVSRPAGVIGCCVLLGFAGNTDMTGVLLTSALLLEYTYSGWLRLPAAERKATWKRWAAGWAAYIALIALAVGTLWPSKQISWQSSGHLGADALSRHRITSSIVDMVVGPWWPIAPDFPHRFWRTTVIDSRWLYVLVPVVLFAYWRICRKKKSLALLMTATLLFGALFADVVYPGSPRHWGIAFISLLIGLWVESSQAAAAPHGKAAWSRWTYALFGVSALAGLCALAGSWRHPLSNAREAAKWVETNEPNEVITGMPDVSFASLAEEMQRRVYFPECDCMDTFKLFSRYREDMPESKIPFAINRAMNSLGRSELLFSFYRPFSVDELARLKAAGLNAQPVASFLGADMKTDNFVIYRVTRINNA